MFVQNGWDTERFERVLTPVVERVYISSDGEVTVLAPAPEPEPGHWSQYGDIVQEIVYDALASMEGEE